MGVAEGDVGYRYWRVGCKSFSVLRDGDLLIGEGGPTDLMEGIKANHQAIAHAVEIRDLLECMALTGFGPLAVTGMEQRQAMRLIGDRGSDTGVHAAAQQHDSDGFASSRQGSNSFCCRIPDEFVKLET